MEDQKTETKGYEFTPEVRMRIQLEARIQSGMSHHRSLGIPSSGAMDAGWIFEAIPDKTSPDTPAKPLL